MNIFQNNRQRLANLIIQQNEQNIARLLDNENARPPWLEENDDVFAPGLGPPRLLRQNNNLDNEDARPPWHENDDVFAPGLGPPRLLQQNNNPPRAIVRGANRLPPYEGENPYLYRVQRLQELADQQAAIQVNPDPPYDEVMPPLPYNKNNPPPNSDPGADYYVPMYEWDQNYTRNNEIYAQHLFNTRVRRRRQGIPDLQFDQELDLTENAPGEDAFNVAREANRQGVEPGEIWDPQRRERVQFEEALARAQRMAHDNAAYNAALHEALQQIPFYNEELVNQARARAEDNRANANRDIWAEGRAQIRELQALFHNKGGNPNANPKRGRSGKKRVRSSSENNRRGRPRREAQFFRRFHPVTLDEAPMGFRWKRLPDNVFINNAVQGYYPFRMGG